MAELEPPDGVCEKYERKHELRNRNECVPHLVPTHFLVPHTTDLDHRQRHADCAGKLCKPSRRQDGGRKESTDHEKAGTADDSN